MSDPEVPQNEQPHDVDHVLGSANEGLDAAAAARDNVPGQGGQTPAEDPDMAAFEAAERDFPGAFAASSDGAAASGAGAAGEAAALNETAASASDVDERVFVAPAATTSQETPDADAETSATADATAEDAPADAPVETEKPAETSASAPFRPTAADAETTALDTDSSNDAPTATYAPPAPEQRTSPVASAAYGAGDYGDAETQVVPAEPVFPAAAPQPIFVQAPEPPRELGNRGAAGGIGLVAAIAFAILYMAATLGFAMLTGDVTLDTIGTAALAAVQTWSFWVPVAVFFFAFWLLGAFVNRARWGKWVTLGLLVAIATYGGHLLGQLFQAPFWRIPAAEAQSVVETQLLAPLAIAAFVIARELTIWFGAWVARSGAKKKALNAEAQAEYERTLEAGPAAMR